MQKPRAGARLALRNSGNGPEILVVGGYDAGNAVGAIEVLKNLNGESDQVQVDSSVIFNPPSLVTPRRSLLINWWYMVATTRFPDLSSDASVESARSRVRTPFVILSICVCASRLQPMDSLLLTLMTPSPRKQVMTLALDQANVVNVARGDEQNGFGDKNMLRGRLWHEAVAIKGNALVVIGGLAKSVLGNNPSTITLDRGGAGELCLVGQNTVCNVPALDWLVVASENDLVCKVAIPDGLDSATSLPGDVLLVTGGRIGDNSAQQGESMQAATSTSQLGVAPFVR